MRGDNKRGMKPHCPYCEEEMVEESLPYCQACKVRLFWCPRCRKPLSRDSEVCPHCGVEIRARPARGGD